MEDTISNEAIVSVIEKTADSATTSRVLSAVQDDPLVREKWDILHRINDADTQFPPVPADFATQATHLQATLLQSAREFAPKSIPEEETHNSSHVRERGFSSAYSIQKTNERVLLVGHHRLILPLLSPQSANTATPDAPPQYQVITTGEGARIGFYEMPGADVGVPRLLRILVDISQLRADKSGIHPLYSAAQILLKDNHPTNAEYHTLLVPLSEHGVGFTDFHIGAKENELFLPTLRGECQLAGATLVVAPAL